MQGYDFRRVSVTALVPAFARGQYTQIPWAKEMQDVLRERGATLAGGGPWTEETARHVAPFFEARFCAVSRILKEKGATQVLELAAGLSPRGMEMAPQGVVYVEADLAESTALKREVVTAVLGAVPEGLHLSVASVVDRAELLACCAPFVDGRPVGIATEGLLRYLTFDEKTQLAATVHEILRRYGGWWITPDIHLQSMTRQQTPDYRQNETATLGRDLSANYFSDLGHAQAFFEGCGFAMDSRPLLEGLPDRISAHPNQELLAEMNERRLFVLTARS
jgi:O-methyltransferase involved in polyketide biosynthesis